MNSPYYKGDRVLYTDGRRGTVYQDADHFWVTASVEFDDDRGCIVQKDKGDLIIIERVETTSKPSPIRYVPFEYTESGGWRPVRNDW